MITTLVPHGCAIAQSINGVRFIGADELALDQQVPAREVFENESRSIHQQTNSLLVNGDCSSELNLATC